MDFVHTQTGWATPKAPPPVKLDTIDTMTNRAINSGAMNPGQNAFGFYDGKNIHLLDVWGKDPSYQMTDNATLLRELSRSMMPDSVATSPAAVEAQASAIQQAYLSAFGQTMAGVGLSPGNLVASK
jgi:hypothetical protein